MTILIKQIPELNYSPVLNRKMSKLIGEELTGFDKPGYYPKLVKYKDDIMGNLGLDDALIKEFYKTSIGPPYNSFVMLKDKQSLMYIMATIHFARIGRHDISKLFFLLLSVKFQSSLQHRMFKFVQPDAWVIALDRVSHKHLYRVNKGIASTVKYLADAEYKRYESVLSTNRLTDRHIQLMVYALRTRLSQSIKSFAEIYYKLTEESLAGSEKDELTEDKVSRIIEKVCMTMCTYGQIDKKALQQAIAKSGIKKETAISIISEVATPDNKDTVRFIMLLMHKLSNLKSMCSETKRLGVIRKVNSNAKVMNYSIKDQISRMIKSLPSAYTYLTMHDPVLIMFFNHYITLYLKNRIC